MIVLCTLYDSNYLNRGLALYESIERYTKDYIMYVLAMDDQCYDILTDMHLSRTIVIRLSEFENETLREAKKNRSSGEYCWTCKAPLIKYAIENSNQGYCAYLDSDLYFYGDPNTMISEMEERQASVMLVGHRYNFGLAKKKEWRAGRYCAGTIVIKNDANGKAMLDGWEKQCLENCSLLNDGIHCGDQKYLDQWADNNSYVVETKNLGAGIAPWNIAQYRFVNENEEGPLNISYKGVIYPVLFYHYHALVYTSTHTVKTFAMTAWGASKRLLDSFYIPYLRHIEKIDNMLGDKYGVRHKSITVIKDENESMIDGSRLRRGLRKVFSFFTIQGLLFSLFEDFPTKYYLEEDEVTF